MKKTNKLFDILALIVEVMLFFAGCEQTAGNESPTSLSAAISGSVTVTATRANSSGTGAAPASATVTINLTNATVNNALSAANASAWFTPTVAGLAYNATAAAGANEITVTIAGTPTASSTANAKISIPAGVVKNAEGTPTTAVLAVSGNITYNIGQAAAAWVDPATQTTQLTGGVELLKHSSGNKSLTGSPYGYETWDYNNGVNSGNTFTWYGANQGGGGAFKVTWTGYFLARLGFYWGNGGAYTQYKNIYIDYNFKRSGSSNGGFIGVYGWSRNPSASKDIEKLIEYYVVDDWFYNVQLGLEQIGTKNGPDGPKNYGEELGSFEVDGATYKIYKNPRFSEPSIDGTKTFTQIFSVRQGRRTSGTISVTEHFKAWSKYFNLGNMYEAKFKVETFGGNGNLDLTYLYLSQEDNRRNIPAGTTPVDY